VPGFGDYAGRYAYLGKEFANAGFDFIAIDQRGQGHSDGRRHVYESPEIMVED